MKLTIIGRDKTPRAGSVGILITADDRRVIICKILSNLQYSDSSYFGRDQNIKDLLEGDIFISGASFFKYIKNLPDWSESLKIYKKLKKEKRLKEKLYKKSLDK
jgi:hypothetical protein